MVEKIPCKECNTPILPSTAQRTGGLCMPCKNRCTLSEDAIDIEIRAARGITTSIKNSLVLMESDRKNGSGRKAQKKTSSIHLETQGLITALRQEESAENTNAETKKLQILLDYILKRMSVNSNEAAFYRKVNMRLFLRIIMSLVFCLSIVMAFYYLSVWLILIPIILFFIVVGRDVIETTYTYEGRSPFDEKRSELADAAMAKIRDISEE